MKLNLLLSFLFLGLLAAAQPQNGFHFDGVDDYIGRANGTSTIASLPAFSMACWVNPANTSPAFPNFDGIIGFRNESNADFFILQLSATNFEARMRNSSGQAFTITSPTCQVNQWQHVALVYTGSQLRFYHNGTLSQSITASGTINNPNVEFNIGRIPFQTTPFWLNGQVDEVGIWSRALSDTEVRCIARQKIDTSMQGLLHYFPMDEGIAGGNNAILPHLTDVRSGNHALFYGVALAGATSNFVAGTQQITVITDTACLGSTYSLHGHQFAVPGSYSYRISASEACDSAIQLILRADTVDIRTSQNRELLTALNSQATAFQWLRCNQNFAPIAGATSATYTATANGSYAVAVTANGCTDTSACLQVNTVGLDDPLWQAVRLFPNPVSHHAELSWPADLQLQSVRCLNLQGQEVNVLFRGDLTVGSLVFDASALAAGMYFIELANGKSLHHLRWIKQP